MHPCAAANQRQTESWGRIFGRNCEATGDPIIGDGLHKKQASKQSVRRLFSLSVAYHQRYVGVMGGDYGE
jgi:hypothetical protein